MNDLTVFMYRTNISFCLYQSNNTKLEQENEHLNKILSSASEEKERIKSMHERELEVGISASTEH